MLIDRRKLLVGLGSLIAAPAVVRAASLMPVRRPPLIWGPIEFSDRLLMEDAPLFEAGDLVYRGTIIRVVPSWAARDLWGSGLCAEDGLD
jgi:hypothetical protein